MVADQDLKELEARMQERLDSKIDEVKERYDKDVATLIKSKADYEKKAEEESQDKIVKDNMMRKMQEKIDKLERIKEQMAEMLDVKFTDEKLRHEELVMSARTEFEALNNKMNNLITAANNKFVDTDLIINNAEEKFKEVNTTLGNLLQSAQAKFMEIDQKISDKADHGKKTSFLPEKMMIPKTFNQDITLWRKWRDDVAKFFDEGHEGIKIVLEEVATMKEEITVERLREAAQKCPSAVPDLEKWKHLYRALEKLTEGEAEKVLTTVTDENGFEAWRQLHLVFEPQLEAQRNAVLFYGNKRCGDQEQAAGTQGEDQEG